MDYIEEVASESKDFNNLLDKAAGSWATDIWTEIYDLYRKCTAYKKIERPDILEVDSTMTRLKEKIDCRNLQHQDIIS